MAALHTEQKVEVSQKDHVQERKTSSCIINNLTSLLRDCIRTKDLVLAEQAYLLYIKHGLQGSTRLGCLLIHMFVSCGNLQKACHAFHGIRLLDVYAWSVIILGCSSYQSEQAIGFYQRMRCSSVEPNPHVIVAVLKACYYRLNLQQGNLVYADIIEQGSNCDGFVQGALIAMYAQCGCLQDARKVFDGAGVRDHALWSLMIGGYVQHRQKWEAFSLFNYMQEQGLEPTKCTFLLLLGGLSRTSSMDERGILFANIVELGLEADLHVGSALINMYAKSGRLEDACKLFDTMRRDQDVVLWNVVIGCMAEHGHTVEAFTLLERMKHEGLNPNEVTFMPVLKCNVDLDLGKAIHTLIVNVGIDLNLRLGNSLVSMYARCYDLTASRHVFESLQRDDVVLWSSMMAAYIEHEHIENAYDLYVTMQQSGIKPDGYIFASLLQASAKEASLQSGRLIHAYVVQDMQELKLFVGNSLVSMYVQCGSLECALNMFNWLPIRDSISFSSLISGYVDAGDGKKAVQLFIRSWQEKIKPDRVTFLCILRACVAMSAIVEGMLVFMIMLESRLGGDGLIESTLIDMFGICGSLEDAHKVFDNMSRRNVVAYTSLISCYTEHEHFDVALELTQRMQAEGSQPDAITWVRMLQACSGMGAIEHGKFIHAEIEKQGQGLNLPLGNALVDMYGKCCKLEEARKTFNGLHPHDVVLWSTMLSSCVCNRCSEEVIDLFRQMQEEGVQPNEVTFLCTLMACASLANLHCGMYIHDYMKTRGFEPDSTLENSLVDMYCKCGSIEHAHDVFDKLRERTLVSWSTIIAGCADHGLLEVVNQHFLSMQGEGVLPDASTYVGLLSVHSHVGFVQEGMHCFGIMVEASYITPTIEHHSCLIDILGRAGCVNEVEEVVLMMPFQPTSLVWVALLGACAKHGNVEVGKRAFGCLDETDGDDVVGYVLMSNMYAACP